LNPRRLVLVTRRFWPLMGGAERLMANLGAELSRRNWTATILTARWAPAWPARITFRGATVIRLAHPQRRIWGSLRYLLALRRWLRSHRGTYDLVCVSMLKQDAWAVLGSVDRTVPVVLRAEGGGLVGDCQWQATARGGRLIRRRCRQAAAVVAPSQEIRRELLSAGYADGRVRQLANGVPIPEPRTPDEQAAARLALADANPILYVPPGVPLAVYAGRLHAAKGGHVLLAAWTRVLGRHPDARRLVAGAGPEQAALENQIHLLGLSERVALAGVFDHVEELLAAADAFILPSYEEGMSLALLEAMAAGLPVVATDIPGNRALVEPGRHGLLVPPAEPEPLAEAVGRLLEDRARAAGLGAAARRRVASEFSLDRMVERHIELFESLIASAHE